MDFPVQKKDVCCYSISMITRENAFTGKLIALDDVLEMKDLRVHLQNELRRSCTLPVVSFSVIMPGPIKQNEISRLLFFRGLGEIETTLKNNGLSMENMTVDTHKAGNTAIFSVNYYRTALKKMLVELEEALSWGRLLDIDVLSEDGRPISRTELGLPERACLVCGKTGAFCSRSRAHDVDGLLEAVWNLAQPLVLEENDKKKDEEK